MNNVITFVPWMHPSIERPSRLVCNACGRYDDEPGQLYKATRLNHPHVADAYDAAQEIAQ